ncbi:hypothetical protein [Azotosporobacter soli]|uniref:hypothetical protein n=1 Tax=Azotosporobacter soli TaxID=3055040 RepID=UPI0031FF1D3B
MKFRTVLIGMAVWLCLATGAAQAAVLYESTQALPEFVSAAKEKEELNRQWRMQEARFAALPTATEKLAGALPSAVREMLTQEQVRAIAFSQLRVQWIPEKKKIEAEAKGPSLRLQLTDEAAPVLAAVLQEAPETAATLFYYDLNNLCELESLHKRYSAELRENVLLQEERAQLENDYLAALYFDRAVYDAEEKNYKIILVAMDWKNWSGEIALLALSGEQNQTTWMTALEKVFGKYRSQALSNIFSYQADAKKAAEMNPTAPHLLLAAMEKLEPGKANPEILSLLNRAVEKKPQDPVCYETRALAQLLMNPQTYYWGIEADYGRAMHLLPQSKQLYLERGLARAANHLHEAAICDFEQYFSARASQGKKSPLRLGYALYLERLQYANKAAEQYQTFLSSEEKGSFFYRLAQLRWQNLNQSSLSRQALGQ